MSINTSQIKVSVVMITYNHADYILEAIESVLSQETSFEFELIIADDNSPDSMNKLVEDYLRISNIHSNKISVKYTKHNKNKGVYQNFIWALNQTSGEFIALCEGDDYWTSNDKLEKQIKLFENHPSFSMVFHSCDIISMFDGSIVHEVPAQNRVYSSDELLLTKIAHTASFVFKKEFLDLDLLNHKDIFGADLYVALMMADRGDVYGMSDNYSIYRKHEGGITFQQEKKLGVDHYKRFVRQFIYIRRTLKSISRNASSIKIVDNCMTVYSKLKENRSIERYTYLLLAIYYRPKLIIQGFKKVLKIGT
jgi:glycosyltransferase involved in cell wall biosynthesis